MTIDEMEKECERITSVITYLKYHKLEAINALFSDERFVDSYKKEWFDRSPSEFWIHLDRENRHIVARLAFEYNNIR